MGLYSIAVLAAEIDDDVQRPTTILHFTSPPPVPTTDTKPKLDEGIEVANPQDNPLRFDKAFTTGASSTVSLSPKYTEPPNADPDALKRPISFKDDYNKSLIHVLGIDNVVHELSFGEDIFKKLQEGADGNKRKIGELTLGSDAMPLLSTRDTEDGDSEDLESALARRMIFPPDTRTEVKYTWPFPYNTVGVVGDHCTGQSVPAMAKSIWPTSTRTQLT